MFVIFSSQLSPSTSSHAAVCCWTSCSSRYAVRHLHLTHCFFLFCLIFPLSIRTRTHIRTRAHTQRQNSLLDDRWQVNNCTASVSQNTDTHTTCTHKHRNKHHLLVLLSLCVQSLVRCLDLFLTAESMHYWVSACVPLYLGILSTSLMRAWCERAPASGPYGGHLAPSEHWAKPRWHDYHCRPLLYTSVRLGMGNFFTDS